MKQGQSSQQTAQTRKHLRKEGGGRPIRPSDKLSTKQQDAIDRKAIRRAAEMKKKTGQHTVVVDVDGHSVRVHLDD